MKLMEIFKRMKEDGDFSLTIEDGLTYRRHLLKNVKCAFMHLLHGILPVGFTKRIYERLELKIETDPYLDIPTTEKGAGCNCVDGLNSCDRSGKCLRIPAK